MIHRSLFRLLQCPTCHSRDVYVTEQGVQCGACNACYPFGDGYVDMMPQHITFDYVSKYVTEEDEIADELDYRELAPPLLAAGVRNRMLHRLLRLAPTDVVLDNGCGSAKFAAWNAQHVGLMIGSDPATLFADAAREQVTLLKADSRRLPFADNSIDKAFSVDVLEHFPVAVIDDYLREMQRVLRPGGQFFVFSNTRELSPIQPVIDISRHIGRMFVRAGVYDFEREARRKSDHIKALGTWDDVVAAFARAGLRPVRVVFWNSVFTTFVEHVLMKLGEAVMGRIRHQNNKKAASDVAQTAPMAHPTHVLSDEAVGARELRARHRMRVYLNRKGVVYYALVAITRIMELDVRLLGWMRSGSYFVVVEKQ